MDDDDDSSSRKEMNTVNIDLNDVIPRIVDDGCGDSSYKFEEPKLGMIFDSIKEAYQFYNTYARDVGFSVRIHRTNSRRSIVQRQELVCSCEGTYKKIKTPQKKRDNRRFDCKAKFIANRIFGDKYKLIEFKSEHSHDLVPLELSHYLKSQRKIDFSQAELMKKMHSSGIKQGQIFSYMCEEAGAAKNLNFTRSDSNNLIQRARSEFLKKGDAECLLEYFKQKKEENKYIFYSFRTHENGEIRGVFFCDAKSRRDYGLFGDVVCFDTTFRTNNYDMLCASIIGINHHGQTSLFGCGLLDGETIDAVMWLFNTFLEAMGGKKPKSIFTDQSSAISNVVNNLFPESHHGLCLWHLCQNAAKNLSNSGYKSFSAQFRDCIYNPETIEEFEKSWDKLLEVNGLKNNEWLQKTYDLRRKWAQVYSRSHFCAGLTTSQRSESINKFLKDYFNNGRIFLREFVSLYSKAMENRREKEKEADYRTQQTTPNFISSWSIEYEAAKIYTKKLFYCFQECIKQTIDLSLELENDDGIIRTYKVNEIEGWKRTRKLIYNHSEQSLSCSCRKFKFDGILCSHALKVFRHLEYKSLPLRYYLKRWTRKIVDEVIYDPIGEIIPNDNDPQLTTYYSELSHISQKIVCKGSRCFDIYALSKSLLLEVERKIEAFAVSKNENRPNFKESMSTSLDHDSILNMQDEPQLRNLTKRRLKGQPSKRIKGTLEKKYQKRSLPKASGHGDVAQAMLVEALNSNQYTNDSKSMHQHVDLHVGKHPQSWFQPLSYATPQQDRVFLSNNFFMSQEVSSSHMYTFPNNPPNAQQGQNCTSQSMSEFKDFLTL